MKKKISVLCCFLFVMASCNHKNVNDNSNNDLRLKISGDSVFVPENSPLLSKISLHSITYQDYNSQHTTTATVKPLSDCMAEVSAPFEGRIVKSFVKLGQKVQIGSPLFELNSSEYFDAVKLFQQTKQEFHLMQMNYQRKKELFEKGVSSEKEFEESESAYHISVKEYEKAKASLEIFNVNPEEVIIGKPLVVRSPIKGEVVRNNIPAGQYIKADAEPVLTVAELNKVWVVAHVKENKIGMINHQDKVQIFTDAYPDKQISGIVNYIGNIVDERTRSVEVYVECENNDRMLKPGMFATVSFMHKLPNVIVIPESAVLQEEDKCYLYAQYGKNRFIKREVTFTSTGDKNCIVHTGLVSGDIIVAEGAVYLR